MDSPHVHSASQQTVGSRPPVTRIEKRTDTGRIVVIFQERER